MVVSGLSTLPNAPPLAPNANTIQVNDKPIFKVSTSALNLKEV